MRVSAAHLGKETQDDERRRKRHTPEQIVKKLRDADAMLNSGKDLCGRAAGAGSE